MDCETCREALSARMDGEAEPVPAEETDAHLAGCSACREWQASALELSRTLRVREAVPVPDLTPTIVDRALPPPAVRGWWPRLALIIVATAQLGLTLSQMFGVGAAAHAVHGGVAEHLFNESTAWNLAVGVGLLWAAFRTRATSGLIPVLAGFVVVLVAYSTYDLIVGAAPVSRVLGHGLLVVGLGLLIVLNRRYAEPTPGGGATYEEPSKDVDADREPTGRHQAA